MEKSKTVHPVAIYGAWLMSTAMTFFLFFQFRETLLLFFAYLGMNQYVLSFVDKIILIMLGVGALGLIVFLESRYRQNVSYRFPKTIGTEMLVLAGLTFLRGSLLYQGSFGPGPLWIDFFVWGVTGTILFYVGIKRQKAAPPAQRTTHLESQS